MQTSLLKYRLHNSLSISIWLSPANALHTICMQMSQSRSCIVNSVQYPGRIILKLARGFHPNTIIESTNPVGEPEESPEKKNHPWRYVNNKISPSRKIEKALRNVIKRGRLPYFAIPLPFFLSFFFFNNNCLAALVPLPSLGIWGGWDGPYILK